MPIRNALIKKKKRKSSDLTGLYCARLAGYLRAVSWPVMELVFPFISKEPMHAFLTFVKMCFIIYVCCLAYQVTLEPKK